ncbi:MAG: hypothetical protein FJ319_09075 [SAR202 cluster bacterium]|nr:hypothetical protein [SAR202 cluster bacterium]
MTNTKKKEEMVASRVSSEILEGLRKVEEVEQVDRSTAIRKILYAGLKEWKLEHAAKLYRENVVTMSRAAFEAGVTIWEMMDYLHAKKIPMQYDLEDLEHDLAEIKRLVSER